MNSRLNLTVGVVLVLVALIFGVILFLNWQKINSVYDVDNTDESIADLIRVDIPLSNVLVQSPLVVKGQARGNWYFEASFPVRIFDANGNQLGVVAAQAKGDWMTTDFVPFEGTLTFSTSTTETGTVVFQKDNPSGLPENDRSVSIPVYFSTNINKL